MDAWAEGRIVNGWVRSRWMWGWIDRLMDGWGLKGWWIDNG